jgi:hypothetical protein
VTYSVPLAAVGLVLTPSRIRIRLMTFGRLPAASTQTTWAPALTQRLLAAGCVALAMAAFLLFTRQSESPDEVLFRAQSALSSRPPWVHPTGEGVYRASAAPRLSLAN